MLAGLAAACVAWATPTPAVAQSTGITTCNTLDQNGKPLPNPNIGFICGQVEAMRQDCQSAADAGGSPSPFLMGHCFGFSGRDVTATGSIRSTGSQSKSSGGSH